MTNKEKVEKVKELLNKIAIITKDAEEPQQIDNYNDQYIYLTKDEYKDRMRDFKSEVKSGDRDEEDFPVDVEGNPLKEPDEDNNFLFAVGSYAQRVIEHSSSAIHNEVQYYTSNC